MPSSARRARGARRSSARRRSRPATEWSGRARAVTIRSRSLCGRPRRFGSRPVRDLRDATVILTRAVADNAALERLLRSRGAAVVDLPCIAIRPLANVLPLRRAVRALRGADRLVVTSRAGIEAVVRALDGAPLAAPLAVVGPPTREAAAHAGLVPPFVPSHADGTTLAQELPLPRGVVLLP